MSESRKIQLVGKRSYAVSLPKKWILENKLKEQDLLKVNTSNKGDLIISVDDIKTDDIPELSVNIKNIDQLSEFIIFCYLKGIKKLILQGVSDHSTIKRIRKTITALDGYEIIKQTDTTIEISFMFNDIAINIMQTIPRMMYLIVFMLTCIKNQDIQSLEQAENSMDKLYHLSEKILIDAAKNRESRINNEIKTVEDIFYIKDIVKRLENIADMIYELKDKKIDNKSMNALSSMIDMLNRLLSEKNITSQTKSWKEIKIDTSKEYSHPIMRIHKLCGDIIEDVTFMQFSEKYFKTES